MIGQAGKKKMRSDTNLLHYFLVMMEMTYFCLSLFTNIYIISLSFYQMFSSYLDVSLCLYDSVDLCIYKAF